MCRSLKVLCVASGSDRLGALKRAAVSASWELAGGVADVRDLASQLDSRRPDVVVLDEGMGEEALTLVRAALPLARVVIVGEPLPGADGVAPSDAEVRDAILGMPRPGGPVRG